MRSTDNLTLGFQSFGDPQKQTVAIVHGWATDSHFLLPFVEIFKDYHVMLIDMPGYGMSEHLKQFSISIRQQANLILNTIPKHTILVSWSLGTLAASVACYNDLDKKVDKFISICGTPRFPCDPNWPGFDYRYVLKSLQLFDEGRNTRSLKLFFKMQTQSHTLTKEQNDFLMDSYEKMGEVDTLVLRNGLMKMAYSDKREPFFGIKVPCLHVFGGKDRLVKAELAPLMINPPYHICSVLENSAHMPFLSKHETLKKIIDLFIKNSN